MKTTAKSQSTLTRMVNPSGSALSSSSQNKTQKSPVSDLSTVTILKELIDSEKEPQALPTQVQKFTVWKRL